MNHRNGRIAGIATLALALLTQYVWAQEPVKPTYGHSMQGEVFNEGPRRKAVLMKGIPKIVFPVTTKSPEAQKFIEQGVAQLHAYWYFEAERSFRQAAALDPGCVMAYWGMSAANVNNEARDKEFAKIAWEKRSKVTPHELAYLDAMATINGLKEGAPKDEGKRKEAYLAALQTIVATYPDDIEAKAFLGRALMANADSDKKRAEAETVLKEVLTKNPLHPVHHYRIHLWDRPDNENALDSAHLNGLSMPASAHMWHMEGHTYTRLRRYADAAESQEASARTDHAHMQQVHILPDQIFNYAHNNQWLVESLEFTGRVNDAITVATNMVALPRHPKYNTIEGYSSAGQGLSRLEETLERYELWDEALRLWQAGYIESVPENSDRERNRLRLLGCAAYATGKRVQGASFAEELEALAKKEKKREDFDRSLATIACEAALSSGDLEEAKVQLKKANLPTERAALLWLRLNEPERALTAARAGVKERPNQALPLAALVRCLYAAGQKEEAQTQFEALRPIARRADLDTPLLAALTPIAKEFGFPDDWRTAPPIDPDARKRPEIASLGPLTWSSFWQPNLILRDGNGDGKKVSLADYKGKTVVVLFYLGSGCARCMEQVNAFAAKREEFTKAGIELVAVSTDTAVDITNMCRTPEAAGKFAFPILADPELASFKNWGAYDDFEKMALHGTFLVDPSGRVRWMDTGFEPFTKADFLLAEAQRLLKLEPGLPNRATASIAP